MNEHLDERDRQILEEAIATMPSGPQPRVGDYVIFPEHPKREGNYKSHKERFSHNWGHIIQTSAKGSFYLGFGFAEFSGPLNPGLPISLLKDTGERRLGQFWFFHHNYARAANGVHVDIPVRVYRYYPEGIPGAEDFEDDGSIHVPFMLICSECEEWATTFDDTGLPVCANHQEEEIDHG